MRVLWATNACGKLEVNSFLYTISVVDFFQYRCELLTERSSAAKEKLHLWFAFGRRHMRGKQCNDSALHNFCSYLTQTCAKIARSAIQRLSQNTEINSL